MNFNELEYKRLFERFRSGNWFHKFIEEEKVYHQYESVTSKMESPQILWVYYNRLYHEYTNGKRKIIETFDQNNSKELERKITIKRWSKKLPEKQSKILRIL